MTSAIGAPEMGTSIAIAEPVRFLLWVLLPRYI